MKKRNILLIICILIIPIVFIACKKGSNRKNYIKSRLVIWGEPKYNQSMDIAVKDFNKRYPNVEVKFYKKSYEDILNNFGKSNNEKEYPNIICLKDSDLSEFASKYYKDILNLNSEIKPYIKDFIHYKKNIIKINENYIAIPYDVEPVALYYRKDIFNKYNIDPESIKTWNDFIEVGKMIDKKSNSNVKMISFNLDDNSMLKILLNQLGTYYFNYDNDVTIDKEDSNKAINLLKSIRNFNIVINNKGDYRNVINNENIATIPSNCEFAHYLINKYPNNSKKWGVIKMPAFEQGGKNSATTGGTSLVLIKSSKTNKDNLTLSLAKYITLSRRNLEEGFKQYGLFPSYIPAYECDVFRKQVNYFENMRIWMMFSSISKQIPNINYTENFNAVERVLLKYKNNIYTSENIKKELQNIKEFINNVIK
ncbi:carbohydrate ABC transporter substrate-binding protein [Clostridium niameyense]|uniref:Carbohydrate ABC transporter substrate-binding protein n=1 Tax=Clostridium niameyense TaxID=1622073 RepID=A0A6M0RC69_9CLOT|nr:ABC transporter substrate-binding protein [Clostridium niameyense]NEZ47387.1 carbohydrate ABC transporter substrate-binding protein [Clostridium niameyense]